MKIVTEFVVAAFYKFAHLDDFVALQGPLKKRCVAEGIHGTILLAREGINGTVAGPRAGIDALLAHIRSDARLAGLEHKESFDSEMPFKKMKVRLKKEIVTLGVPGVDPNAKVGTYVAPQAWNALIADPDVIVVDTRNDYEFAIGSFNRAINPETETFREFPAFVARNLGDYKGKKIATFCTGGIRCEKATSFMLQAGFSEVYHLKGGILKYLEEVAPEESLWQGECYVFDERVSVGHGLVPGDYALCRGCGNPILAEDKLSAQFEDGVTCPKCCDTLTELQKSRFRERQRQMSEASARRQAPVSVPISD
jgi:UPF0176 protein